MEDMIAKGQQHPLAQLSKHCLNNDPTLRPTAEEIVTALEEITEDIESCSGEVSKVEAVKQVSATKQLLEAYIRVRERANELGTKSEEIKELQSKLEKV